jgi:flagellar motor switch protein FliN/FliY
MTSETTKNDGSEATSVALEEEKTDAVGAGGPKKARGTHDLEAGHVGADRHSGRGAVGEGAGQATTAAPPSEKADLGSVRKAEFQEVSESPAKDKSANLDLLLDVVVPVAVELGRTSLTVEDILSTCEGSVIELDRAAGEPVDIMVGGKPLARGEVVVVRNRFGVRITELIGSIETEA